ncbi:unnamed protein product [Amoebophrya sp. A120]|nr:unnamed protein product [Amoebophrya sp. A120]|eukprot:GSA120T00000724001.1
MIFFLMFVLLPLSDASHERRGGSIRGFCRQLDTTVVCVVVPRATCTYSTVPGATSYCLFLWIEDTRRRRSGTQPPLVDRPRARFR